MKRLIVQIYLILALVITASADVQLNAHTVISFASAEQGQEILGRKDDFINRLSPFDRAARLKTDQDVSEKDFLDFIRTNVLSWDKNERIKVEDSLKGIFPELKKFPLKFPEKIYLIKTTGNEEGNTAYTRANAIVIPQKELHSLTDNLEKILAHEFFHILTRNNPRYRENLYSIIGFKSCNEISIPDKLKQIKITNPDAPVNNHYIEVTINGDVVPVVPILLSRAPRYDPQVGGEFFKYLVFQLLLIKKDADKQFKPVYSGQQPLIVDLDKVSGYLEQVGSNTHYIIHPEEILADNFALIITREQNIPSPEILDKMKDLLSKKV